MKKLLSVFIGTFKTLLGFSAFPDFSSTGLDLDLIALPLYEMYCRDVSHPCRALATGTADTNHGHQLFLIMESSS